MLFLNNNNKILTLISPALNQQLIDRQVKLDSLIKLADIVS